MTKKSISYLNRCLAVLVALVLVLTSAPNAAEAATKSKSVSTQAELDAALKNSKYTSITIKTDAKTTFTLPAGKHSKVKLSVYAPNAKIKNKSVLKNVAVHSAASYYEYAAGNTISVYDNNITLKALKNSEVKAFNIEGTGAAVDMVVSGKVNSINLKSKNVALDLVQNGQVSAINIDKKATLNLEGAASKATTITTATAAKGTKIDSSVKVQVNAGANLDLKLAVGAEGSTLKLANDKVEANLTNKTLSKVSVTDVNGNKTTVAKGKTADAIVSAPAKEDKTEATTPAPTEAPKPTTAPSTGTTPSVPSSPSTPSATPTPTPLTGAAKFVDDISKGGTVTLAEDLSTAVNATYTGTGALVIELGNKNISATFTLTAPNATAITINDAGEDAEGATITNLIIDAPKAHVENNAKVTGTLTVKSVSDTTMVIKDSVTTVSVEGKGNIEIPKTVNLVTKPNIEISTKEEVKLTGSIPTVTVKEPEAAITVAADTSVKELTIEAPASAVADEVKVTIKSAGDGAKIESVAAAAPLVLEVPTVELAVTAPVEIKAEVTSLEVNDNAATVAIDESAEVKTVIPAATVTAIEITGSGKVEAIDTTKTTSLEVSIPATVEVETVVAAADAAITYADGSTDLTAKQKTVKAISVDSKDLAKTEYFVGEELDLSGKAGAAFTATVVYSDDSTTSVEITASMVTGYDENTEGVQTLTVTYAGLTDTFTVTVKTPELTELEVITQPTKTEYYKGDTFEFAGLVLRGTYEDGSKKTLNYTKDSMEFGLTEAAADSFGTKTFTATIGEITCNFEFVVLRRDVKVTFMFYSGVTVKAQDAVELLDVNNDFKEGLPIEAPSPEAVHGLGMDGQHHGDKVVFKGWTTIAGKVYTSDEDIFDLSAGVEEDTVLYALFDDKRSDYELLIDNLFVAGGAPEEDQAAKTIELTKNIEIPAGDEFFVHKGVVLDCKGFTLTIGEGAVINVFGTLKTGENKLVFSAISDDPSENKTLKMYKGSTWVNGATTFKTFAVSDDDPVNELALVEKASDSVFTWFISGKLDITDSSITDWDALDSLYTIVTYDRPGERLGLVLNGVNKFGPSALELLQDELNELASAAANVSKVYVLDSDLMLGADELLVIPKGVTLEVARGVVLKLDATLEKQAEIKVYGSLKLNDDLDTLSFTDVVVEGTDDHKTGWVLLFKDAVLEAKDFKFTSLSDLDTIIYQVFNNSMSLSARGDMNIEKATLSYFNARISVTSNYTCIFNVKMGDEFVACKYSGSYGHLYAPADTDYRLAGLNPDDFAYYTGSISEIKSDFEKLSMASSVARDISADLKVRGINQNIPVVLDRDYSFDDELVTRRNISISEGVSIYANGHKINLFVANMTLHCDLSLDSISDITTSIPGQYSRYLRLSSNGRLILGDISIGVTDEEHDALISTLEDGTIVCENAGGLTFAGTDSIEAINNLGISFDTSNKYSILFNGMKYRGYEGQLVPIHDYPCDELDDMIKTAVASENPADKVVKMVQDVTVEPAPGYFTSRFTLEIPEGITLDTNGYTLSVGGYVNNLTTGEIWLKGKLITSAAGPLAVSTDEYSLGLSGYSGSEWNRDGMTITCTGETADSEVYSYKTRDGFPCITGRNGSSIYFPEGTDIENFFDNTGIKLYDGTFFSGEVEYDINQYKVSRVGLQRKLQNAADGATVKMLADETINLLTIPAGKTLDTNGKVISFGSHVVSINVEGTLLLSDLDSINFTAEDGRVDNEGVKLKEGGCIKIGDLSFSTTDTDITYGPLFLHEGEGIYLGGSSSGTVTLSGADSIEPFNTLGIKYREETIYKLGSDCYKTDAEGNLVKVDPNQLFYDRLTNYTTEDITIDSAQVIQDCSSNPHMMAIDIYGKTINVAAEGSLELLDDVKLSYSSLNLLSLEQLTMTVNESGEVPNIEMGANSTIKIGGIGFYTEDYSSVYFTEKLFTSTSINTILEVTGEGVTLEDITQFFDFDSPVYANNWFEGYIKLGDKYYKIDYYDTHQFNEVESPVQDTVIV